MPSRWYARLRISVCRHLTICVSIAWVMGAADPTSGTVSLHEVVKGFGTLLKNGWKPLRNVVIASWDAEEVSDSSL